MKQKNKIAGGKPVCRDSQFFNKLVSHGSRNGKALYKDDNGYFYLWDSLHGQWQMFNDRGFHIGVLDKYGKKRIKNAVKGRTINI